VVAGTGRKGQASLTPGDGVGLGLVTAALAVVIGSLVYSWLSSH
jgi:hypothetical protein